MTNPFSHQLTPMKDTELRKNKLTSTLENDTQERTISERYFLLHMGNIPFSVYSVIYLIVMV